MSCLPKEVKSFFPKKAQNVVKCCQLDSEEAFTQLLSRQISFEKGPSS
jgi:hypothetical protein